MEKRIVDEETRTQQEVERLKKLEWLLYEEKEPRHFGYKWSLNLGPFTIKEHVCHGIVVVYLLVHTLLM